jgi:ketosteroid isomerase-like protein
MALDGVLKPMQALEIPAIDFLAVKSIFAPLEDGNADEFFAHVADDVVWTVEGTHPLAGRYLSKESFREHTFDRLAKSLPDGPHLRVDNILVSGPWAVVELTSHAVGRNGMPFENHYCWLTRFCGETIVEVRAYLDSALVQKLIDENER